MSKRCSWVSNCVHLAEELEREAERVPDAHRAAHPGELAGSTSRTTQPRRSNSAASSVEVALGANAEREPRARRAAAPAQHQRVVQALLPAAQVERVGGAGADDEPEQVDVEVLGRGEVGDRAARRRRRAGCRTAASPRAGGEQSCRSRSSTLVATRSPRRQPEARDRVGAERDVDDLGVAVELERVVAALAADPRLLGAAERRAQVAHVLRVDPAHAGVDRLRDAVRAADVVGPDVGREPVRGRVRQAHRLGLVVERRRDEHRPEDLLLEDRHRLVDVADHRRLEEVALRRARPAARRRRAPARPPRAPTRCSRARARGARDGSAARARCAGRTGRRRGCARARSAIALDDPLVERPLRRAAATRPCSAAR